MTSLHKITKTLTDRALPQYILNIQNKIQDVNIFFNKKKTQETMGHCLEKACSLQHFGRGQKSMLRCVCGLIAA